MAGLLRQRRDQADRGRSAADHHNPLPRIVERVRPVLWMHHLPGEVLDPPEVRRVRLVVVVIAGCAVQEPAPIGSVRSVLFSADRPGVGGRVPVGGPDVGVEADMFGDAVLVGGVHQVLPDLVAAGDGMLMGPRLEREAQREDVAVGANTRVAEQIPRPAQAVPSFQHRVPQVRVLLVDAVRGVDARDPGADDQHIEVFSRKPMLFARALVGNGHVSHDRHATTDTTGVDWSRD